MVRPNFWIDKKVERERASSTQLTQRDRVEGGTVTEQVDATHIAVRLDGSELPDVVAPSESGVSAVGAWVRAIRDSTGRIVKFGIPDSIPSGAEQFSVGVTGERLVQLDATTAALDAGLESAQADLDAAKAELDGKLAENTDRLTVLDESKLPALTERVGSVETNLASAQTQIGEAQGSIATLNDETLPGLQDDMRDAARLTEGTLDNARLNVGTLAAQIANVIQLNVSRLVADSSAINAAVINKLAVAIANVIELNADRITAGTIDTSRLNAQSVAAAIAQFLQLDVGQLTADTANIGDAVAQKIWAGVAKFAEITTEMLTAGHAVITGDMMVDRLIGKILVGAQIEGGEIWMRGTDEAAATTGMYTDFSASNSLSPVQVSSESQAALTRTAEGQSGYCAKVTVPAGGWVDFKNQLTADISAWNLSSCPLEGVSEVHMRVKSTTDTTLVLSVGFENGSGTSADALRAQKGWDLKAGVWTDIYVAGPDGYRMGRNIQNMLSAFRLYDPKIYDTAGTNTFEATILRVDSISWVNRVSTSSAIHLWRDEGVPRLDVLDYTGRTRASLTAPNNGLAGLSFFSDEGDAITFTGSGLYETKAGPTKTPVQLTTWQGIADTVSPILIKTTPKDIAPGSYVEWFNIPYGQTFEQPPLLEGYISPEGDIVNAKVIPYGATNSTFNLRIYNEGGFNKPGVVGWVIVRPLRSFKITAM